MQSPIVQKDNKILRKKAKEIAKEDIASPKIREVIKIMKSALSAEHDGVAIAAPQVGELLRLFVVAGKVFTMFEQKAVLENKAKKTKNPPPPDRVFINPKLIKASREKEWVEEGCLSVRYLYGHVLRSKKVRIRAYDEKGVPFELGGTGLLAQIFQHELDHLEGTLFTDKAKDVIELTAEEYAKQK